MNASVESDAQKLAIGLAVKPVKPMFPYTFLFIEDKKKIFISVSQS